MVAVMGIIDRIFEPKIAQASQKVAEQFVANMKGAIDLKNPKASLLFGTGSEELYDAYRQLPYVYAVINAIAKRISTVPVKFYRAGSDREFMRGSPAIDRLMQPTALLTFPQLIELWVIYKERKGEAMFLLDADEQSGVPLNIQPYQPHEYREWVENNRWLGWTFLDKRRVPPEQVIYDRYIHPDDRFRGLAPLTAARLSNESEYQARRYNRAFFENDATPGGYYKTEADLTEEQFIRLRRRLIDNEQGAGKAHKSKLLSGDLTWESTNTTQKDAQFVEQFNLTLHDICAVFGVDPVIIGREDLSKYATAKEARRYFWTDKAIPYMRTIESKINNAFLGRYDLEMRFDVSNIEALSESVLEKAEAAKVYYEMGVPANMINERLNLGFEEIPGGDEPRPANAGPQLMSAQQSETKEYEDVQRAFNITRYKRATDGVNKQIHQLEKELRTFWRDAKRRLQKRLGKSYESKQIDDDDIDKSIRITKLFDLFYGFIVEGGRIGWQQIVGRQFDEAPEEVINIANQIAGKHVKLVTESARDEVRKKLREATERAIAEGLTEAETQELVEEALDGSIDNLLSRSKTIARTEVHSSFSQSRKRAMDDTEPVKKRWLAAPDARDSHLRAEGAGAIDWNAKFPNGLEYPLDPNGPPSEVINCRCILEPIYEGEE
jgi:HK97 family phage portal protein